MPRTVRQSPFFSPPTLAGDTIDVGPQPLELTAGTGAIRIEGGGLISLSGDGTSQVFQIDSGANVTLDGLVVEEGSAAAAATAAASTTPAPSPSPTPQSLATMLAAREAASRTRDASP